jgi:hypothetical protein
MSFGQMSVCRDVPLSHPYGGAKEEKISENDSEKGERATTRHFDEGCAKCGSGGRDVRLVVLLLKSLLLLMLLLMFWKMIQKREREQ